MKRIIYAILLKLICNGVVRTLCIFVLNFHFVQRWSTLCRR